jgi:hypothetical protein
MACYHPIQAYQPPNGERLTFVKNDPRYPYTKSIKVACGKCIGCRLNKSGDWATRVAAEAQLYENNSFLTLTYNDEKLPENGQLVLRDMQLFFKRLRKKYKGHEPVLGANPKQPYQIRYLAAAEYSEEKLRPHYHVCLLNFDFADKKLAKKNKHGQPLYTSKSLDKIWGHGHCWIGDLTYDSAAYVARYVMKKITGDIADEHYTDTNQETGEIFRRKTEFNLMSRKPGIGFPFMLKYQSDIYTPPVKGQSKHHDFFRVDKMNGTVVRKPSRFFDNKLEEINPDLYKQIKDYREAEMLKAQAANPDEFKQDRLDVKEKVLKAKIKDFKRD